MKLNKMLLLTGLAAVLTLGVTNVNAQGQRGGRNFDPSQMRQRMMDRYRETLDVKDDAEWKVLETQISKVMEARMAIGFPGMRMGRRGGNNPNRPNPFGGASAAEEALQKAVDAKAPAAEIKTKLDAYRADVKVKEAKLEQAQDDLKKLLTQQQEAAAVLGGLLK